MKRIGLYLGIDILTFRKFIQYQILGMVSQVTHRIQHNPYVTFKLTPIFTVYQNPFTSHFRTWIEI